MNELKERFEMIAQSANQYLVNFDQAWQWVGYSRKDHGLKVLQDNFENELDFSRIIGKSTGGRPYEEYFLTVDCFKSFCMMAGTEKGKEVRKYYLAVERELFNLRRSHNSASALSGEVKPIETKLVTELVKAFRLGAITSGQFQALIGAPPAEYRQDIPKSFPAKLADVPPFDNALAREDLRDFMEKRTVFEDGAITVLETAYAVYLDHYDFSAIEIASGEALSRHKFTRWILKNYGDHVSEKVVRVDGKPARCFIGMKLRSFEELAESDNLAAGSHV